MAFIYCFTLYKILDLVKWLFIGEFGWLFEPFILFKGLT